MSVAVAKSGPELRAEMGLRDESVVAIIGCGPAGMLAAHAAASLGKEPVIFAPVAEPSLISGAQYLHEAIPDLSNHEPDGYINYVKKGEPTSYARKVYGDPFAETSWDKWEEGRRPAWSLKYLYDSLWKLYAGRIVPQEIHKQDLEQMRIDYPLVICTAPKTLFCCEPSHPEHAFSLNRIWVTQEAQDEVPDNTIIYNGEMRDSWCRSARIFGSGSTEYPGGIKPPHEPDAKPGRKPLENNCDCFPWLSRTGRFGRWEKGVLVHQSFRDAVTFVVTAFEGL